MKKTIIIILLLITSIAYSQNKQDTSTYYLVGGKIDFENLKFVLRHPQDVTPRQDSQIVFWIERLQKAEILKPKTDSRKAKK